jgi:excisionase family DNA binding protein
MTVDAALAAIVADAVAPLAGQIRELRGEVAALRAVSPPKFGTVADAARILGVSDQTIRRKITLGEILSMRVGRSVRVDISSLRPADPTTVVELARAAREQP